MEKVSEIDKIYAILKENDEQSQSLNYDLIKKLYEHLSRFPINSLSTPEEVSELVKCVLRYVDCLMSFCYSVKVTRKNLLKVKIFFQCIADLFDSYEMKNVFISDASESIFNLILEPWIKPWFGKELLKVYNTVIHESSRKIRSDTLEKLGLMYLYKFIDLLTVYGDYEFQTVILEAIFRICDMNKLASLSSKLLPESELLSIAFMEIGSETFDDDARIFLNLLNNANSKIFSTICDKIELDDIQFEQSSTKGVKGIWVDFDMEELTLSWNCDRNALYQSNNNETEDAETSSWENILLLNSGIEKIKLSTVRATVRRQMLLIILRINENCISCTSNIQHIFEGAKTLKLYVSDPKAVNRLAEYVLPKFGQRPQIAGSSVASQGSNSIKRSQLSLNSNQPMFYVISDGSKSIHSDDTYIIKPEVSQYLYNFTSSDQFSGASTSIVSLAPVIRNIDETNKVSVNSSIGNMNKKMSFSTENLSNNLSQNNTIDYQYPENIYFDHTQKDGNAASGVDPDSDKILFQVVNEENKVSIIEQSASPEENCDQNASIAKLIEHRNSLATDFDQIHYDLTVILKDNSFLNQPLKKCSEMTNKIQKNSLSKGIEKQKYKSKAKQKQMIRKIIARLDKNNISRKIDEMLKTFEEKDPESKNTVVKPPFTFDNIYNRFCEEVNCAEERLHEISGRKHQEKEEDSSNEMNPDDLKDLATFPFTLDEILESFKAEQPTQTDSKKTRSSKGKDSKTHTHKAKKHTLKEITINKEVSTQTDPTLNHTPSSKNSSRKRKLYDPNDLSYLTDLSSIILGTSPVAVQKNPKVSTIREINESSSDTDYYISTTNLRKQNKNSKDKRSKTNLSEEDEYRRNNAIEVPSGTKTSEECNPRIIILSDVVLQKPKQITPLEPKVLSQRDEFNEISVLN